MSNILAIAQKELKGYFATPIGWIVIGMFALLWGWFYYVMLVIFNQQSLQLGGLEGGGNVDINAQLIRPLFLNASVILLFVLPLVTMRTYSEEKRSGTIELLLTSPVTDVQIILGKFLGAMTLYAAMLAITAIHMGLLFSYGNPEWRVVVVGYLGLLLMGGCFVSVGLLISSLTKNQIVAGMVRIDQFGKFSAQRFDLLVIQRANAGEITARVEEFDLLFIEAIFVPRFSGRGRFEKIGNRTVTV